MVATSMSDSYENRIAIRLQHFLVIPTPAEGGEESRAIAKAKSETPRGVYPERGRRVRIDMNRSFSWAVVPRCNRGIGDSGVMPPN